MKAKVFTIETGRIYTAKDIPAWHRTLLMSCHHSGACDQDVKEAAPYFAVNNPDALRDWLKEFGAWDQAELSNDADNLNRLLWLAAGDLHEQGEFYIGI